MAEHAPYPPTRPSLLVRLRDAQDAAAWTAFVDLYGPLVYGYARKRGLQDADAADLVQEVLTQVARCVRRFEYQPERGRFRDWLGVLTQRCLSRFFATRKRTSTSALGASDEEAGPDWGVEFDAHVLRAALERSRPHFEPLTWRAFERVWLENHSARETAAELKVSIEKVYVAKSRVLKRLEAEVLSLADDLPRLAPLRISG